MNFKTQCANCHKPLGDDKVNHVFGVYACSKECETDLDDLLDVTSMHEPASTEFLNEIKARGRNVDCDCTKYCKYCVELQKGA